MKLLEKLKDIRGITPQREGRNEKSARLLRHGSVRSQITA